MPLEVLQHALESYCNDKPRTRKLAVLHLAQAIELTIKAALVEKNISIYEKDNARTLNTHKAIESLARCWSLERLDGQSRIELLVDERNAIQHRYGSVDDVTLDYHMQTAFDAIAPILRAEFDIELADWVRDNVEKVVWEKVRFVAGEEDDKLALVRPVSGVSPVLQFVDGFSRYESNLRALFSESVAGNSQIKSTLDVVLKTLSNLNPVDSKLIAKVPQAYRLRNNVVHGDADATGATVKSALSTLNEVLTAVASASPALLERVLMASDAGIRGTSLPDVPQSSEGDDAV